MNHDFSLSAQSFKYWEIFLSWLFKYSSRCYELKQGEKPWIYKNPSKMLHRFGRSYRQKSASKGIICKVTSRAEDIQQVEEIFQEIYETIEDPTLCEWAACEVMAKVLAYRNLKKGQLLSLPIMEKDGRMVIASYVVDHVFDLWKKVSAFGLVSKGGVGAPILLFRGTDFSLMSEGGRFSMISDLDPKGPGWTLFEKGKREIQKWLDKENRPARVIGHSLGGIIATYTLIQESSWMSDKSYETSYAFNFPGVSEELACQWNALDKKPAFTGFICRGDVISKLGTLFGMIYEVSLKKPLSPIRAHEILLFSETYGSLNVIDLAKENGSSSRKLYSKLQKQTSSIIYEFGLRFLFPRR